MTPQEPEVQLTALPLVGPLLSGPQAVTSPSTLLSKVKPLSPIDLTPKKILCFDCETHNKDFADPKWTPYEIISIAWSWLGSDVVESSVMPKSLPALLERFRSVYDEADMVIGHNIRKFDLPSVNGAMLYLNLAPLGSKLSHDTLGDFVKTRGIRRSLDKHAKRLNLDLQKGKPDWDKAWSLYTPHSEIRAIVEPYVRNDVMVSKEMYRAMLANNELHPPKRWTP